VAADGSVHAPKKGSALGQRDASASTTDESSEGTTESTETASKSSKTMTSSKLMKDSGLASSSTTSSSSSAAKQEPQRSSNYANKIVTTSSSSSSVSRKTMGQSNRGPPVPGVAAEHPTGAKEAAAEALVAPASVETTTTTTSSSSSSSDEKSHMEGEIDWLKRAGNPTKSPSSGLHKPTWKPSFKPNEQKMTYTLMGASYKAATEAAAAPKATATKAAKATAVKDGKVDVDPTATVTLPTIKKVSPAAGEVPFAPADEAVKEGVLAHLRPEDADQALELLPAGTLSPPGAAAAAAQAGKALPIGDVDVAGAGSIEEVVAHTTVTKVATTDAAAADAAAEEVKPEAPRTVVVDGVEMVPAPLAEYGLAHPRPQDA
jgi:hypothetical protein